MPAGQCRDTRPAGRRVRSGTRRPCGARLRRAEAGSPIREASSVPAAAPEPTKQETEDDQDNAKPDAPHEQDDDPDDDQDCTYAHELLLSLEIAPEGLFPFDCLEQGLEIAFSKTP